MNSNNEFKAKKKQGKRESIEREINEKTLDLQIIISRNPIRFKLNYREIFETVQGYSCFFGEKKMITKFCVKKFYPFSFPHLFNYF